MRTQKHQSYRSLGIAIGIGLCALACKREDASQSSSPKAASSVAVPAASADTTSAKPSAALSPEGCIAAPDYLLPPTKYGDSDLIRAMLIDGSDVVFGNMSSIFRLPLAGGTPQEIGKAPGLTLRGLYDLWLSGDKLITQSPGEAIFMEMPHTGGSWSTFANLSPDQAKGGRDAATRILQSLGKGGVKVRATAAAFDGETFYWTEESPLHPAQGVGRVRAVARSGGEGKTLYEAPGGMDGLVRAGEHLVFVHTAPPTAEAVAESKKKKYGPEPKGAQTLVSIPRSGGTPVTLGGISQWMSRAVLVADGETIYVSGYEGEDLTKPGVFRLSAAGGAWERVDPRVVTGRGLVYPGGVVLTGSSFIKAGELVSGEVILAGAKSGPLTQVACFTRGHTTHAWAVTGKTLLISLFAEQQLASIVRVPLP